MENIIWNYCSSCGQNTKHSILFSKIKADSDEFAEYGRYYFLVIECNGCESVSFRHEHHDYFEMEMAKIGKSENEGIYISNYPYDLQNYEPLKGKYYLPEKIKDVYNQTLLAFKGKSYLLTGIGFRAIIEAICIEEKIKGNNLEQKINNLAKNRLITDKEADRLHSIRFLGNDSVHEMEIPDTDKLYLVLSIIEHLLRNLYLIDLDAKKRLDTIIKDFKDFEKLVMNCLEKFQIGDEKTLREILNKHIRRISVDLVILEKALIDKISNGDIDYLILGSNKPTFYDARNQQHFIIKENSFLPF